jgi:hypothetical protein
MFGLFMVLISFLLAFLGFSLLRSHFWPLAGVLRKVLAPGYAEKSRGYVASFAKASAARESLNRN